MQKNVEIGILLDCYQTLLTPKQADILALYYEEDLSLTEITEHYAITRQAVLDLIRRGEKQLYYYEERLGLAKRKAENSRLLEEVRRCAAELSKDQGVISKAEQIVTLVEQME